MTHDYCHLYNSPATGLRFFTVYGPWGRPDMAPMLFAKAILAGEPINVFNNGELYKDFTFIDDIAEGVLLVIDKNPKDKASNKKYYIGCSQPVHLMDFIHTLENELGKKAILNMIPLKAGDVLKTFTDTSKLFLDFGYKPMMKMPQGIAEYIK